MIRHIVLMATNEASTPEAVAEVRAALATLDAPGRASFTMGPDLGLRPGNFDVALVADFEDEAAFLAYDADTEHDRIRREMIAPITVRLERCQFHL
ncbi:MAG: Dabb family protein [Acidimicrobiales bacterium]